jgi:hypothetical protein
MQPSMPFGRDQRGFVLSGIQHPPRLAPPLAGLGRAIILVSEFIGADQLPTAQGDDADIEVGQNILERELCHRDQMFKSGG